MKTNTVTSKNIDNITAYQTQRWKQLASTGLALEKQAFEISTSTAIIYILYETESIRKCIVGTFDH